MHTLTVIEELGRSIERAWAEHRHDERVFAEIAADQLRRLDVHDRLSPWEVLRWSLSELELPTQRDQPGRFGQPPLTLFNAPRFHIDVYLWFDSTTAIHAHGFCGAFQVWHGSSVQTLWRFDETHRHNLFLRSGVLAAERSETLTAGRVQSIEPGDAFIHSLYHLEHPSATLVVRTHRSPVAMPQFNYLSPGLAYDPFFDDPTAAKQLQVVRALVRSGRADDELLASLLDTGDIQSCLGIVRLLDSMWSVPVPTAAGDRPTNDRLRPFVEIIDRRFPELQFRAVLDHERWANRVSSIRTLATDPDQRFVLAALLNVPTVEGILSLVAGRHADVDPIDQLTDVVTALGRTRSAVDGPNLLGSDGFEPIDEFVVEALLQVEDRSALDRRLARDLAHLDADGVRAEVGRSLDRLRPSPVLRPLLATID